MANIEWGSPARRAESQVGLILSVTISFTILSCVAVVLRLFTRQKILHACGADDVAIFFAEILSCSVLASTVIQLKKGGLGRHTEFLSPTKIRLQNQALYANLVLYNAAQLVTKISFLLQYRRLFPLPVIRTICTYGIVFLAVWGAVQLLITTFSCVTVAVIAPSLGSRCISKNAVANVIAVMNVVTDIAIFAIPIWPVKQLQISRKRKMNLLVVFCFGFFVCSISIIRLHDLIITNNSTDPLWEASAPACWSAVELNVGILCACLPTLRPLVRKFLPRLDPTTKYQRNLETISMTPSKTDTEMKVSVLGSDSQER